MDILIAADMEGITGVVNWDQVSPGHSEYERFRGLMTEDVNAAARGAFEAGAQTISVVDGHSQGNNILIERLDPRVRLICGTPSPLSMIQGVEGVDGVLFVGYHARAGTAHAILDHTWSSRCVHNVWLNGEIVGEYGLNAAMAGYFGVPVAMVSGDQTVCAQVIALLGSEVETAVVKQALGRYSAQCLAPEASRDVIQHAAHNAVRNLAKGRSARPYIVKQPVTLRVEFSTSDMADGAVRMDHVEREGAYVSLVADSMLIAYQAFRSLVALAAG
jgi:D-amino peptidase